MHNPLNTIRWKVEDKVGHLVLNQPPANHMDNHFFQELKKLVTEIIPGEEIGAVVIYGEGRHFSSGAQLEDLFQRMRKHCKPDKNSDMLLPGFLSDNLESFRFFSMADIPAISLVKGVCLGAAFELTLFCDIRICAEGALLGLPETSFNLLPGLGGIQNMLSITNPLKTMEIVLTGNSFTASEAMDCGIIDMIIGKKFAVEYATAFAKSIVNSYDRINIKEKLAEFHRKFMHEGKE